MYKHESQQELHNGHSDIQILKTSGNVHTM